MSQDEFILKPVPPYRLDLTVWTLRRRVDNIVDRFDGSTYRRVLPTPDGPMEVAVRQAGTLDSPRLHVATSETLSDESRRVVTAALERLLGVRVDLSEFHRRAALDKKFGPLVHRFRGMKPPRFATLFEGALNSIACQQVTLTLGIKLLNRLTDRYGQKVRGEQGVAHAFPRPEQIAGTTPEELRELGFSRNKGRSMIELARLGAIEHAELTKKLENMPDEEAVARLCELRGIGRWSAEYILLRYLGRTHLFPGDDVGARNNLVDWLGLPEPLDYDGVRRVMTPWSDFGGLLYFHLLLSRLAEAGFLDVEPAPPLEAEKDDDPANLFKNRAALMPTSEKESEMTAKQSKKRIAKTKPKLEGPSKKTKATATRKRVKPQTPRAERDIVYESGLESFPASDPPSWSPLATGPPKRD